MSEYIRKVQALVSMGERQDFRPARFPGEQWFCHERRGISRNDNRFFRVIGVIADKLLEPLILREATEYTEGSCDKRVEIVELPIRLRSHTNWDVGISIHNPRGSFGKPVFTAPRHSMSGIVPGTPHHGTIIHEQMMRADASLMSGISTCRIVLNAMQDRVVWFTADELRDLLNHEFMTDALTRALVCYLLANQHILKSHIS